MKSENNFAGIIKIANYTDKDKLLEEINKFLSTNYHKKDFYNIAKETPDLLILNFHSETEVAECTSRFLKLLKLENKLFSNISIFLHIKILNHPTNKRKINLKTLQKTNTTSSIVLPKLNNILSKSKNFSTNDFKSRELKRSNLKSFESIFLAQGPYKDKYEIIKEENRRNKALWLNKKGFNPFVGKETILKNSHMIKNYVNLEPTKSPLSYRFRTEQKSKWVGEHDFYV